MFMLMFYIVGCIIAYCLTKDTFKEIPETHKGFIIIGILCSWATVCIILYNMFKE